MKTKKDKLLKISKLIKKRKKKESLTVEECFEMINRPKPSKEEVLKAIEDTKLSVLSKESEEIAKEMAEDHMRAMREEEAHLEVELLDRNRKKNNCIH